MKKHTESGFTLIELMLAMALFTMLLVVMLGAFTQINATYYKGIASSRAQEAVRKLSDDIAKDAKTNGLKLPKLIIPTGAGSRPMMTVVCSDTSAYYIIEGVQATSSRNIAVKVNGGKGCLDVPLDYDGALLKMNPSVPSDKYEALVGGNISIHGLVLNEGVLRINTLYGDPDAASGTVAYEDLAIKDSSGTVVVVKRIPRCAGGVSRGFQFCATSQLTTVLQNRLR